MNIFVLNDNPKLAAQDLCDKHCVKMILESTQILSTVAQLRGHKGCYKITHSSHPCVKWTANNSANWNWLIEHSLAMCLEYTLRYNKIHSCEKHIKNFKDRTFEIWNDNKHYKEHTPFEKCMPEQYKRDNVVDAYRAYYVGDKAKFAKWKMKKPEWFQLLK